MENYIWIDEYINQCENDGIIFNEESLWNLATDFFDDDSKSQYDFVYRIINGEFPSIESL